MRDVTAGLPIPRRGRGRGGRIANGRRSSSRRVSNGWRVDLIAEAVAVDLTWSRD